MAITATRDHYPYGKVMPGRNYNYCLRTALKAQLVFLLVIMFTSCQSQSLKDEHLDYLKTRVPEDLINELPGELMPYGFGLLVNLEPENGEVIADPTQIYFYSDTDISFFDSIESAVEQMAIAKYKYSDTCNVILHKFQKGPSRRSAFGSEWVYENWVKRLKRCQKEHLPIPNFVDVGINDEDRYHPGLSDDFDLYVLEAKQGKHFPDKYYVEPAIMPEGWEHGHTKGYALNEKEKYVIFWFVIW